MYVEVGGTAMAVQVAPESSWNENAKAAAEKLTQYGFEVVVYTGELRHNQEGVTGTSVAGTTVRQTIFISSELDIDGMETAYHEAFHATRNGKFAKYHGEIANIIASNVDTESASFEQFVSVIADLYAYTVSDVSAAKFKAEIIEEFYAWYVGKAYASNGGEMQAYMAQFSDMESIKQQIDGVYAQMEANADKALPGLLEGDMEYVAPAEAATAAKKKGQQYSSQETDLDSNAHPYAYNTLISKPDMVVTTVNGNVPKNRADVVYQAKQNAAKVGTFDPKTGSVSVYVDDVGAEVVLATNGLKHSLDRRFGVNAPVVLRAGEILHNSIRINEMTPKKEDASESYILIGTARNENGDMYIVRSVINRFSNELASMDVLYAINAKKEPAALLPRLTENSAIRTDSSENRPSSMLPGFQGPVTDSTISIAELLDLVNKYFPDILPEDVLKHYGYDARPEGDLGKDALYSGHETDYSNRSLLANAFEGITQNSNEYKLIQEYKGRIKILNEYEEKLAKLNAEIRKLTFGTEGGRDSKKLKELQTEAKKVAENINRNDKKLLSLEASEPLRKVIERERKKEAQKTKEHVKEIQQNKKARAERTELRHKIRKAIRDLDKLLKRGNKKLNVKEDLQPVVTKALQAAEILFTDNYGTYDMLRNGLGVDLSDSEEALVKTCTQMLKDLDKMPTDGYDNWQARQEAENRLRNKMSKLNEATLNRVINSLTAEQKAYVDEMQEYLSDVMGVSATPDQWDSGRSQEYLHK